MHSVLSSSAVLVSVLATSVFAAPQTSDATSASVHDVQVGPGLTFTPDSLTAAVGDWVQFTFGSGHDVAQGSFDAPCQPLADGTGVFSGMPNEGDVWRFQVNSTDPIWLYCSVPRHCQGGMSLVVNPPDNQNTLEAYRAASSSAESQTPPTVQGGVFGAAVAANGTGSSNSSSAPGSSATTSSSASASASASRTSNATGSAAQASSTGNAASNLARDGLFAAGALAGAVAALL